MAVKKYYAVAIGRQPGIYTQWYGKTGAHAQIDGFQGARYKGFATIEEARAFVREHSSANNAIPRKKGPVKRAKDTSRATQAADCSDRKIIYTDGSSLGNPGPGGYGVVIPENGGAREFSGGFRKTTNNRMELLACIVGVEQLTSPSSVALYSDSRYVVDGMTKGWAKKWQANGWRKSDGQPALNIDLWERLLTLCERHDVRFIWVKGHAGNAGNERCDQLATQAAGKPNLPPDTGYKNAGSGLK
jgi:ribonuclease HI